MSTDPLKPEPLLDSSGHLKNPEPSQLITEGKEAMSDNQLVQPSAEANNPLPDTSRQPGYISIFDPETFAKAGLETLNALKDRYTTYASVVSEAETLRVSLDNDQLAIIRNKARIGGLITLAKYMTQGSKSAVPRDFKISPDTANCQSAFKRDPLLECAPGGGQNGRFELTPDAGLLEDGSHDEAPIAQRRLQTAGC